MRKLQRERLAVMGGLSEPSIFCGSTISAYALEECRGGLVVATLFCTSSASIGMEKPQPLTMLVELLAARTKE